MDLFLKFPNVFSIPFFGLVPQPQWGLPLPRPGPLTCSRAAGSDTGDPVCRVRYKGTPCSGSDIGGPDPMCQGKARALSPASTGCRKHRRHLQAETGRWWYRPHSTRGLASGQQDPPCGSGRCRDVPPVGHAATDGRSASPGSSCSGVTHTQLTGRSEGTSLFRSCLPARRQVAALRRAPCRPARSHPAPCRSPPSPSLAAAVDTVSWEPRPRCGCHRPGRG